MIKKIMVLLPCMLFLMSVQSQMRILPNEKYNQFHIEKVSIDFTTINEHANQKSISKLPLEIFGMEKTLILQPAQVMSPELAKKYPGIKTFKAYTKDGKINGRITMGAFGIYAQLYTDQGAISISPNDYNKSKIHEVRLGKDPNMNTPACAAANHIDHHSFQYKMNEISNGKTKRTYTLAIVTTHEFFNMAGATEESATETVVAAVNATNELFENELAVNFNLLPPKLFTTPDDPFDPELERTEQANDAVFQYFDYDEFDIGHVLNGWDPEWPGGGVAYISTLCDGTSQDDSFKARGWTGTYIRLDIWFLNLFAHELGHMFGATHTWNGIGESCERDQYALNDAYEIGSGSTIMSYNGNCGEGQNTQKATHDFFHSSSIIQMLNNMENARSTCVQLVEVDSGNEPPQVNADPCNVSNLSIPHSTPFLLHGEVFDDAGGDDLSYAWEQYDADSTTQGYIGEEAAQSTTAPLFKTLNPSPSPIRYFPDLGIIFGGLQDDFQSLPAVARDMNFKLIARDSDPACGGISIDGLTVNVSEFGPFQITSVNNRRFNYGDEVTITWNTNGSEEVCDNLAVLISYNNGASFDFKLAEGLPYADGSASFTLPENTVNTTFANLMLACDDNDCVRFFDLYKAAVSFTTHCVTTPSSICDATPISAAEGSTDLNLDLKVIMSNELITAKSSSCEQPGPQNSSTDYTFIAVSREDNVIRAESTNGDFRTLAVGDYDVFGVSYKSSGPAPPVAIDPTSWVGQNLDAAINRDFCAMKSTNAVPMEITGESGQLCGLTYDLGPTVAGFKTKRCLRQITYDGSVRDSEAFIINDLVLRRKYIFSFCDGYDPAIFEARVIVQEYNSENGDMGNILSDDTGCHHNVRLSADSNFNDVLIIVTDNNDCQSVSKGLENGVPQFKCTIGRINDDNLYSGNTEYIDEKMPHSSVFPNPAQEELNILVQNLETYDLTITDPAGNIISTYSNSAKIDIGGLSNGLYLIHIQNEKSNCNTVKKFVVMK